MGGGITLALLVLGATIFGTSPPTTNPYLESLTTCTGKQLPFYSENSTVAGIIKCDNGTLIKVHYVQVNNGTLLYSGFKVNSVS